MLFLENEAQIDWNNRAMLFMSKQASLPEISSILQKKWKSAKNRYMPFLQEGLQLLNYSIIKLGMNQLVHYNKQDVNI